MDAERLNAQRSTSVLVREGLKYELDLSSQEIESLRKEKGDICAIQNLTEKHTLYTHVDGALRRRNQHLKLRPVMYMNLGAFLDSFLVFHFLCRSPKFTTSHVEDALNS